MALSSTARANLLAPLHVPGPSSEYYQIYTSCHSIRLPFLHDDAIKGLEESQLIRECIGYETADEREVAGDKLDSASNADENGGGSSGAPPLLLLASEGKALGSAGPSPLPLHHSSHSPFFLGSLSSLANAA
jgi:hypothetical protein